MRPEKISVRAADAAVLDGEDSALGTVRDVVYVGMATRFIVELNAGGTLTAVQQNLQTTSSDVHDMAGTSVRLAWRKEHEYQLG